ncbi:MAG: hypothetical protein ACLPLR_18505 [Terriglobales bacterium]
MKPNPITKAIAVALIQVLIVSSLGAKLLYDRRTRPQAWFKTERFDPNLPIRGRYVSLQIEVNDPRSVTTFDLGQECGSIAVREGVPVAEFDESANGNCDNLTFVRRNTANGMKLQLTEPSLFFIPDTAQDPRAAFQGDELWVLATIPRHGPPRPIALGVKKTGEKDIQPLNLD